jgi:hypothetical protein
MKAVIKGWVHLDTHRYIDDKPRFAFFSFQSGTAGFTPICEHTIEVELPATFSRIGAEAEAIKAEIAKVAADYHATVRELQERLSKLQAIEYAGVA